MRKRKILTFVMACSMLLGQTAWAQEASVAIRGMNYDQEVGAPYTGEVEIIEGWQLDEAEGGQIGAAILKDNGELWMTYPEPGKVKDNVRQCLISSLLGTRNVIYILDKDNVLWNEEQRLAEDVTKFDDYYALDSRNNLKNLHTGEIIEQVSDWHVDENNSDGYTLYVLKMDGNLDGRKGSNMAEPSQAFETVKTHVTALNLEQFLCEDGTVYEYTNLQTPVAVDVKTLLDIQSQDYNVTRYQRIAAYYDLNDSLHIRNKNIYGDDYVDFGKLDAAQIESVRCRYGGSYGETTIILTKENDVYAYKKDVGISKIDSDVKLLDENRCGGWVYQKLNGEYYDIEDRQGKRITVSRDAPVLIDWVNRYDAYTGEVYYLNHTATEEDNIVVRKEEMEEEQIIEVLNHADKIWRDRGRIYALRTDGTVWDVTEIPKLVLDLKTSTYIKGDVNEDGEVNIKDLQIILRGVCEKVELTERQRMIADVVEDGEVDIQDLRKELRFVCGKIEEL